MMFDLFKRKEKRKETFLEFLFIAIGCWLISIGTALIVDAQYSIQIGLMPIVWQTLFAVVASTLFTRKWWIPIIYFGILVPVFFLAIVLSGDIHTFIESFVGFIKWWVSGLTYDSKWYSKQGFYLMHTFMNVGIGVLYFAIIRIFKRSLIVVATVFGFIVVNYSYGHTGYNELAIPFLIAGVFPLVAGEKFQNLKLPDFKNLFGIWGKKWLLVLISTLITVAISFGAFSIANKGQTRNRFCSDIVADIQTVSNVYLREQKKLDISLFDIGLVMNSTYVGGNLYNIKPKPLAATTLKESALVKITSFDTYDGVMWDSDFEKSYRINGFWDYEQNSYLAGDAVSNDDFVRNVTKAATVSRTTITLLENSFFVPVLGQVIGFNEETKTTNPVLFNKSGSIFSYYGFEKGYKYAIDSIVYESDKKALITQLKKLSIESGFTEDPLYDVDCDFYKSYTQLPKDLPKNLSQIFGKLKLKGMSEYEKAYTIAEYFSYKNGYVYDREPNNFKRGDDIIERLLATKKGHCVYYSTAMVIMARMAGIPSRFVAGYKTIKNPTGKLQIIDASSPYAWVECYIPNIGWVSFDPAPDYEVNANNVNKNLITMQQTVVEDVDEDDEEVRKVAGTNLKWNSSFDYSGLVILGFVLLVIIGFIFNAIISQKFYTLDSVRKRFSSTKMQTEYFYCDILRQFSWLGYRLKKGETLREVTARVCEGLSIDYALAVNLAINTVEELHYGNIEPSQDAVLGMFEARTRLENVLKDRNNKVAYVIKRRILLPIFCPIVYKYK